MKFSIVLVAAGLAAAQTTPDLSQFPSCALPCLLAAVSETGCSPIDTSCLCGKQEQLKTASESCIKTACDTAEQAKAQSAANGICGSASGSASSSGAASTGSGSSSGTAAPTTGSATSTGTGVVPPVTTASSGHSTALPSNATSTTHGSSARSGSATTGVQTATSAPGNSGAAGPVAGALAALAAAVFAL